MAQLPPGEYDLRFDAPGFPSASEHIVYEISNAAAVDLDYCTVSLAKDSSYPDACDVQISGGEPVEGEANTTVVRNGGTLHVNTALQPNYRFGGYTAVGVAPKWEDDDPSKADQTIEVQGKAAITAHVVPVEYEIRFVNDDGTVLQAGKVAYGQVPEYTGEAPTKQSDATYTYAFEGWTPEVVAVTGDATYEATYSKTLRLGRPKVSSVIRLGKSSASVRWTAAANAAGYELQWRVRGGKWKSAAVKSTSKAVKGLSAGKLYQFRVRAVAGSVKGAWSNVSGRYYRTVSLKSVRRAGAGAVSVAWKADPKVNAGYAVIVRDKLGGKVIARKVVSASETSATVRGLKAGKKVWVRVRSLRTVGGITYIGVLSAGRLVRV